MANSTDNAKSNKPNTRRNFLLGATLGTAGAVAVAVAGSNTIEAPAETLAAATDKKKPRGYHVTPHIEQYYDTTRM
jgi:nitrous oxide reductase